MAGAFGRWAMEVHRHHAEKVEVEHREEAHDAVVQRQPREIEDHAEGRENLRRPRGGHVAVTWRGRRGS